MAFLRSIWKNGKHDKVELGEKNILKNDFEGEPSSNIPESVSFRIKYLGSTLVTSNTTTSAAVDTILNMAKASKQKRNHVIINVTLNGILITDAKSGNLILDASVYRISNCSTDPLRSIFTFFAMNKNDITECHAFYCHKRKIALKIALTVANSFRLAYEAWQRGHQVCTRVLEEQRTDAEKIRNKFTDIPVQLIDFSDETENCLYHSETSNNWVMFDNDKEEISKTITNRAVQLLPPPEKHHSRNLAAASIENKPFLDDLAWT